MTVTNRSHRSLSQAPEQSGHLDGLARIAHLLSEGDSLEEVAPAVLEVLRASLNAQWCALWLPDESGLLQCVTSDSNAASADQPFQRQSEAAHQLCTRVWETGKPQWIDGSAWAENPPLGKLAAKDSIQTRFASPIFSDATTCGVIGLQLSLNSPVDDSLITFVDVVGSQLGNFIRCVQAQAQATRMLAVVDSVIDAVITISPDGTVESINAAAIKMFGYSPDEVVGRNVKMLMPLPFREEHDGYLQAYLETGVAKIIGIGREVEAVRKDGVVFPIELAVTEAIIGDRRLFTGVVRDISDSKRAEAALRDSEGRFRSIADNAPVALYIKDLEGHYTLANRLACEALGCPEGVEGSADRDLLPADVADRLRERDLEVIASGQTVESEEVVDREGFHGDFLSVKFPIFDSEGNTVGLCGVSTDITQRKRAQEAWRESEERFTRFMHHLPGLAWIKDKSGKYVFANEAATRAFQVSAEELYGNSDADIFPPATAEQFRANDQLALSSGTGIQNIEELEHQDGIVHYSLVNKFPIPGPEGIATLVGGMAIDITELKQAEEALLESEERFRTLASQAPVGIFMSAPNGDNFFVNDSWSEMAGLSAQEAQGQGWIRAVHPEDRERVVSEWNRAVGDGVNSNDDFRFRRPDGRVSWLQGSAVPMHDANGQLTGYIGTIVDITKRKMAELALRESEERLRFTMLAAQVAFWDWSMQTGKLWWSKNLEEIHDRPAGSFDGTFRKAFREVYHSDRPQVRECLRKAIQVGGGFEVEYRFFRQDGSLGWIHAQGRAASDSSGRPTRLVGICMDVTERRRVEEYMRSLAEASVILSGSLDRDSTLEAIARLLVPTFGDWCAIELYGDDNKLQHVTVTHSDPQRVDLALELRSRFPPLTDSSQPGVARAIRTGRTEVFSDLTDEDLRELSHNREHYEILQQLGMRSGVVAPLVAREKTLGAITLVASESRRRYSENESGIIQELARRCALAVDNAKLYEDARRELAERRRAEESLMEAHQVAETANRSKSAFLANMSHEIRTPMSAILGYAELLGHGLSDPELLKYVEIIRRNGGFLLEILNDVLDLSRIEAGRLEIERQRFSPQEVFFEVCSLMKVRADEKELPLVLEFNGPVPESIESDPMRLRQIVINLVSNAIKFTESGSVKILVRHDEGVPLLRFDVTDTGIGVSQEQLSRLFEPFSQADSSVTRRYGGSGVGLAICKRLVEMLGGWIEVRSTPGQGSTFSVAISTGPLEGVPLVRPQPRTVTEPRNGVSTDKRLDCRVLIVDDQPEVRYLVQNAIQVAGGETVLATNGHEALEAIEHAQRNSRPIDVVILDMQMPVMDGYQAATRLRSSGCRAPIIAMTAHAMRGDREKCLSVGCDEYLSKPIDFKKLIRLIRNNTTARLPEQQPSDTGPGESRLRVLIVEDDKQVCKLMCMQLQTNGYEVSWATTGSDALKVANRTQPHVVVLDLGLPDMNGFEVVSQIKKLPSMNGAVLIALSGRSGLEYQERARTAGFDHYLLKPASVEQLEALFPLAEKSLT